MRRQRHLLLPVAAPLAAAGLFAAASTGTAATTPTDPTPPPTPSVQGVSSAQVISIPPLKTCVSCTSAQAGPNGSSGSATALELFGTTVEGGGSKGNGNNSGALVAIPANPLLVAALLDWQSASSSNMGHSSSSSRAAVADVALAGGQVATVSVLEGDSSASWTGTPTSQTATGHSETNGATADVGQGALVVVLLHSDSDSSKGGNAYVASINGNQILSSSQTGGSGIPITIPGVGTITLLAVNSSGGSVSSTVGSVDNLGGQQGNDATALGTKGSGGTATGGVQGISTSSPSPSSGNRNQPTTAASSGGLGVPNTGAELGLAAALALMATGGGVFAIGWVRRRRSGELRG